MESTLVTAETVRRIVLAVGPDRLMDETIDALHKACAEYGVGSGESPRRAGFEFKNAGDGLLEWMPFVDEAGQATIKVVGYHPLNPVIERLPTILATVARYDARTGRLVALVDGTFLTALRTGAASAVVSRVLARPDSDTIGMIGCGAQAVTQLHALARVFDVSRVLFFDVNPSVGATFENRCAAFETPKARFEPSDPDRIRAETDILCTATSVEVGQPGVFDDGEHRRGLHINAVGADLPGKFEIPESALKRAFVCADFPEQALEEGECRRLSPESIGASMPDLIRNPRDYRGFRDGLTVFDSTGWALEDHAAMDVLLRHAARLGVAEPIRFETGYNLDPWDPYGFVKEGLESEPVAAHPSGVRRA